MVHSTDVLPSQSLGLVLKKLNPTLKQTQKWPKLTAKHTKYKT